MLNVVIVILILAIVVNEVSKKFVLADLIYKRELSNFAVEIGESFSIITSVENKSFLPISFLQIIERVPSELFYILKDGKKQKEKKLTHEISMFVMPKQRITRTFHAKFSKRGFYTFNNVDLIGGDILGLSTTEKCVEYGQGIIVYPKTIDFENEFIPYGDYYGDISVKCWIISDPILNVGVREMTDMSSLRKIPQLFRKRSNSERIREYYLRIMKLLIKKKIKLELSDTSLDINNKSGLSAKNMRIIRRIYIQIRYKNEEPSKSQLDEFIESYTKTIS